MPFDIKIIFPSKKMVQIKGQITLKRVSETSLSAFPLGLDKTGFDFASSYCIAYLQ